jgi:hypothetical protein
LDRHIRKHDQARSASASHNAKIKSQLMNKNPADSDFLAQINNSTSSENNDDDDDILSNDNDEENEINDTYSHDAKQKA